MSEVIKGVSKVWDRLFDQKAFLNGEINFVLKEFEEKRGDCEVDSLFKSIEDITDIKDTKIYRLCETANEKLIDSNRQLSEALSLCSKFPTLEEKYLQRTILTENRNKRKHKLKEVMDEITAEYSKINTEFEQRESELQQVYKNMESKLL